MTRERLKMLLDLAMDIDEKCNDKPFNIIFDATKHHVDISIQDTSDNPADGIYATCYSNNSIDSISHGIRLVDDPELEQAETHLRRLIYELSRVDT